MRQYGEQEVGVKIEKRGKEYASCHGEREIAPAAREDSVHVTETKAADDDGGERIECL